MGSLSLLLYPASELQDGLLGLFLRRRGGGKLAVSPLLGLGSQSRIAWQPNGPVVLSDPDGIRTVVTFRLSKRQAAWFWHVHLTNTSPEPKELDIVYTHDVALAPYGAVRTNEYYVSQYLDLSPVPIAGHGPGLAVRQNMPGPQQPWALIGCLGRAVAWATDALQLVGRGHAEGEPWAGLAADLPSSRLQHEHSLVALQTAPLTLAPGASQDTGFFGILVHDHPAATSHSDAAYGLRALADRAALPPLDPGPQAATAPVVGSLFLSAPVLACYANGVEPPVDARHVERLDGVAHSWFTPRGAHVVTAAKQRSVLRPHGAILRTGSALVPDERGVTATAWMDGTFMSQVTQGHVSRGSMISLRRSYLGLQPAHGLRIFVAEPDGRSWARLGVPSSWEVDLNSCRWRYVTAGGSIEVSVVAPTDAHVLRLGFTTDRPLRVLVAAHISLAADDGALQVPLLLQPDARGVTIGSGDRTLRLEWPEGSVETVSDDAALRSDGRSVGAPWVTVTVAPTVSWSLVVTPGLVPDAKADVPTDPLGRDLWTDIRAAIRVRPRRACGEAAEADRIDTILPWFAHDALIHYLSPRGLEQYTGGGWGTRDVCQGPIGLFLALGEIDAMRHLAVRILRAQNARGDWPQAFEFYARHTRYQQDDAHGDVVYWPLLALAEYLAASGDVRLLDEEIPFVGDGAPTAPAPVLEHVLRALDIIENNRIPGTDLPAYGNGDWNDSLQPANPALAVSLVSTWTVTLEAHALGTLADALDALAPRPGPWATVAARARRIADQATAAMLDLLLADGVLAGYGLFDPKAAPATRQRPGELLIHPTDHRTGLHYSLLPMIHAISWDLLSPDVAAAHLQLITDHLTGPDGARLFDRPASYSGGPMHVFQRAEASTFFGREIGLMYMHAHLRYAEALARMGRADAFFSALALANPIGVTERVPSARPRQATTYFSSSDAAFADRYLAATGYRGVIDGRVPLEGGWRVYSSGPGIFVRLVVENLLGIRLRGARIEVDPVLPAELDGLAASVHLAGRRLALRYRVRGRGCGVQAVWRNGVRLATEPLTNPYREPGVAATTSDFLGPTADESMALAIEVG